jgi:pimeloyl-ACP methyl ester carboxylesterase
MRKTVAFAIVHAALLLGSCTRELGTVHTVATSPSVVITYRAIGSGLLIVLLPSAFRGAEDLEAVASPLASSGFRVVLPEPRGIGASRGPLDAVTLRDFASDVAGVIRREGGGPAVVAGHAYGNWVARMTAADHPDLVLGVAVIAASRKGPTPVDLVRAIADASDAALPEPARLAALRRAFFAPGNNPRPYLRGWHIDVREVQRRAAAAVPQHEYWSAGGKPILEVQAAQDPFLPAANRGDLAQELGPQVATILVEDASHALVAEQPCLVAAALATFAAQLNHMPEKALPCH